jgi:pyrimidine deaminase RibD-like protein
MRTSEGSRGEARTRRRVATKFLEVAELAATEEGDAANNVVAGVCVLAGIAAGDALCLMVLGHRYAGQDHAEAARLLSKVDLPLSRELSKLVRLKPMSHYGSQFINTDARVRALRAARRLVDAAEQRVR